MKTSYGGFILMHQPWSIAWSMMLCYIPNQVSIRRCFSASALINTFLAWISILYNPQYCVRDVGKLQVWWYKVGGQSQRQTFNISRVAIQTAQLQMLWLTNITGYMVWTDDTCCVCKTPTRTDGQFCCRFVANSSCII